MLSATFGSALSFGGPAGSDVFDLAVDGAGNSYVTGFFGGTVDFDLSQAHLGDADILTARGENDAFVAKYAPDDSLVWVRRMGGDVLAPGAITDVGRTIAVDDGGNVYVAGEFRGSADFGATTLEYSGVRDRFVAKFDSAGSFAWAKQLNDGGASEGVGVDANGNVYTLGRRATATYDISKFDATGQSAWTKSIVTNSSYYGDLAVSAAGNVYVVGDFSGTVDFDPSAKKVNISVGSQIAAFVLKLDGNGKFAWVSPFSGGYAIPKAVTLDDAGNVIVGGNYGGTVDFNPGKGVTTLDPAGGGYITKLSSSGSLVWARALVGGSVEGLDADAYGAIYATGSFSSSIDLDPGMGVDQRTSAGESDIFLVKLTSAGNYAWGETFGGVTRDVGWSVGVDAAGYVHLAGFFTDIVDFDSDPLATSFLGAPGARRNGFLLKLQQQA